MNNQLTIHDLVKKVIIIAYKEDTTRLEEFFYQEGFYVIVKRGMYTEKQKTYPAAIRCLINHSSAWQIAVDSDDYIIVCESDFVPCKGFGKLRLPFDPNNKAMQMAWLYSVGPVIYHYDNNGGFFGHNAGTVAYILDSKVAQVWLEIYQTHEKMRDFRKYYQWEVEMPINLRQRGIRCYISYKCYGEHGGLPNAEHAKCGFRAWHQAESLVGPLAFLPAYAKDSFFIYLFYRTRARLRGIYKLVMGKYFDGWRHFIRLKPNRWEKLCFVLKRTLT